MLQSGSLILDNLQGFHLHKVDIFEYFFDFFSINLG